MLQGKSLSMALLAMKLSLCWICAVVVPVYAESPFAVQWSEQTYGPDGPWHAVSVELGSSNQAVDLYPGDRWASTILIDTLCSDTSTTCYAERGGLFNINASDTANTLQTPNDTSQLTWLSDQTAAGVNNWGGVGHVKEGVLADSITFKNGLSVPSVSMASIYKANQTFTANGKEYPVTLGTLSLGGTKPTHVVQGNTFNLVSAWAHWNRSSSQRIPSYSWGMHIGSVEPDIPGSLVLGGYDQSRVLNEVSTQQVDPDSNLGALKIYFKDIGMGVATGDSPFDFEAKSSLFKTGTSNTTRGATAEINPVLPYLYLPRETCDAMAANLPITYNEDLNLYFWNTSDDSYQQITSSPAYMSFIFGKSTSNSQNLTVKVPFQLLKLTLQEPLVEKNTTYFPCYPSNTLVLGRAFLQAAFISVNWGNGTGNGEWSLAQAPGPVIGTGSQRDIGVNDESVTASENSWEASWDGYWEPLSSKTSIDQTESLSESSSEPSSGLSTGAKAGIGIGCAAGALGLIGMIAWLCIRRRKGSDNAQSSMGQYDSIQPISHDGTRSVGPSELNNETLNELHSDKSVHEVPGASSVRHELS